MKQQLLYNENATWSKKLVEITWIIECFFLKLCLFVQRCHVDKMSVGCWQSEQLQSLLLLPHRLTQSRVAKWLSRLTVTQVPGVCSSGVTFASQHLLGDVS